MSGDHARRERLRDAAICVAVTAIASTVRLWGLAAVGLTHFDEGAYTLTGRWIATLGREGAPFQPVFSPPLFPALVGAAFTVFGVRDVVAVGVSAVAGGVTVGVIYAAGRVWLGRSAAVVAALALAATEYHVVFSRLALTDATFTLLFWAALAAIVHAGETRRVGWFVAGGVLTGLCWLTKYHGAFPIVLAAAWWTALAVRGERFPVRGLSISSAIATAVYVPWAAYVQATMGYGRLLAIHAEHSFDRGVLVTPPGAIADYFIRWTPAPLLVLAAVGVGAAALERRRWALFVMLSAAIFLASATLYLSFPRLALPAVPAACLLAGAGLEAVARRAGRWRPVVLVLGVALVLGPSAPRVAAVLATQTDAYREAADYVRSTGLPAITELGKNAYFYESRPSLEVRFHTAAELDAAVAASPETLVVVDPIVERLPDAQAWLRATIGDRAPERVFPIGMYEPVVYQGFDPRIPLRDVPRSIAAFRIGEACIEVYRVTRSK